MFITKLARFQINQGADFKRFMLHLLGELAMVIFVRLAVAFFFPPVARLLDPENRDERDLKGTKSFYHCPSPLC